MTQATPPEPAPPPVAPATAPAATPATPVRRPGLDPATRRQTFIVAIVIAALFYGSSVLNEALPANAADQGTVAIAGEPLTIGDGVRITPVGGWVSSPQKEGSGIRLEKGIVVIDPLPGDVSAAMRRHWPPPTWTTSSSPVRRS
jgi:hypothetical protein